MAEIIDFLTYQKRRKLRLRKSTRVTHKAEKQGSLDSMCGAYSIVNAISLICKLTKPDKCRLFKQLVRKLDDEEKAGNAMTSGIAKRRLHFIKLSTQLLKRTKSYFLAQKEHKIR